jgi:hypothetical protein
MKARIIKGWRQFTTEEHHGRHVEPKWDFTELIKVMQVWAR